jgi:hypothetical protein
MSTPRTLQPREIAVVDKLLPEDERFYEFKRKIKSMLVVDVPKGDGFMISFNIDGSKGQYGIIREAKYKDSDDNDVFVTLLSDTNGMPYELFFFKPRGEFITYPDAEALMII